MRSNGLAGDQAEHWTVRKLLVEERRGRIELGLEPPKSALAVQNNAPGEAVPDSQANSSKVAEVSGCH